MKLPNSTKKQKTRATLSTTKIMSLIIRMMRFKNFSLGKIETTYVPTGELSSKKSEET
jgi:hypothetical protein